MSNKEIVNKLGEYQLKHNKINIKFGMNAWGVLDEMGIGFDQALKVLASKDTPVQTALMIGNVLFAGYGGWCLLNGEELKYNMYQFREWINVEIDKEDVKGAIQCLMDSIPKPEAEEAKAKGKK